LEYFFTERYCLYTKLHDGLYRANVHHPPWPLQKADATINKNSMLKHLKIDCENKLHLLFSEKVDAIIWDLEKVNLK
jgi:uncharacterized protein YqjF (DUF2071 family)